MLFAVDVLERCVRTEGCENVRGRLEPARCPVQGSLDNINLFSIITILSLVLITPITLAVEGVKFTPAYLSSAVRSS